jgi:hypothetical protein
MAETPRKRIIIVAGVEFPRYAEKPVKVPGKRGLWWLPKPRSGIPLRKKTGSDWRGRGLRLAKLRLLADPTLIVCLYDFDRATLERVELVKGQVRAVRSKKTFPPLVDSDYRWVDNGTLRPVVAVLADPAKKGSDLPYIRYCPLVSQLGTGPVLEADWHKKFGSAQWDKVGLSIRHVYSHIEAIGANNPGTLVEFHQLGHASSSEYPHSGTALVNTNHLRGRTIRYPLDLDPRGDLDFLASSINQTKFRKAFARDAFSQVWGCNWYRPVYSVVRQVAHQLGTKTLTDTMRFTLAWGDEVMSGTLGEFMAFVETSRGGWDAKRKLIVRDGAYVRRVVLSGIAKTYMQHLANASGHCVAGGLPATYSEYDVRPEGRDPLLMNIPMRGKYGNNDPKSDSFLGILAFYEKSLGITFRREGAHPRFGRGYALYCPKP